MTITGDNPIQHSKDDTLGRAASARSFAQQVLALDASRGVVVGVLGAWGSGKTSFINLTRSEFERASIPMLDFNPWMFSGAEQLVESFFVELAAELKIRPGLAEVGKCLEDYGEAFSGMAWLPLVGPWIERGRGAAKILGKILKRRKEGVRTRRDGLERALSNLSHPIIVVLDDIDRLSTAEIRDVFRLVRLTASFPNIIYVMAFDRVRVEKALTEHGVLGRDYMEKIIHVAVDLPAVANHVLSQQIASAVTKTLSDIEKPGPFDEQVWPDLLMEIVRPLVRNMRDVRRYAAAVHGTAVALDGKIALADMLALEAVRVFLPDVFGRLHGAIMGLTTVSGDAPSGRDDSPLLKAQVEALIKAAGVYENVVRAMIDRLFPAGKRHLGGSQYGQEWQGQWFKERRVAHVDILRLYLERIEGEGLQTLVDAEKARAYLADRKALDGYLRSIEASRLQEVIESLEAYEEEFVPEHVVPATIVLLNLLPDLPERQRGFFEMDTRLVVTRVTYRLLRSLGNPAAVEAAVRQILPELTSLSAKLELISDVGHRERRGFGLVPETIAAEFEMAWRNEVRSTSVDNLVNEDDPLRVLLVAKREATPSEGLLNADESPRLTLAVLRAARSEALTQTDGSRAIRRSPHLAWDALVELYGDEATLRTRIEKLKETRLEGGEELLKLADKYLGGWRPE